MSLVHVLLFIVLLLPSPFYVVGKKSDDEQLQTYMVRIQNDLKPTVFTDVEEWYKDTLRSTSFMAGDRESGNFNGDLIHVYRNVFHGFSARLSPQQVKLLKTKPSVIAVLPDKILHVHTTRTPHFLGLDSYSKPKGLLKESDLGSNVVIGILDTGIWPESPSFSDDGLGPVPSHFKGGCYGGKGFPSSLCNKKLVGARYFAGGMKAMLNPDQEIEMSARDQDGHGTHTASTAAGRLRSVNASFYGYAEGVAAGIAPKARLAIYKVCFEYGCINSDILAGFDKAVEDGVDVISISIGGFSTAYSSDPIAIGSFGATERRIFVSASGGNDGPSQGSVTNIAPWITTTGASTIDRNFPVDLVLNNGVVLTGSSLDTGKTLGGKEQFPIVLTNSSCTKEELDPSIIKGKIAVCTYADISAVEKGLNVKAAGGVAVVVANSDQLGDTLVSEAYLTPGLSIGYSVSKKLVGYLNSTQNLAASVVFRGTEVGGKHAPAVASFSSRGPNPQTVYVLKPDVLAPGVDILAAWPQYLTPTELPKEEDPRRSEFNILSGTSSSCPHVAGIAALIKGAHPDWTPAMIRSALMTTSYNRDQDGKPFLDQQFDQEATIWATGSGHVNPEKANSPGLVLDISVDDYIDFLCASKYDESVIKTIVKRAVTCKKSSLKLWDFNYPAIVAAPDETGQKVHLNVTRTLTNVNVEESIYSATLISPKYANVTVAPTKLKFTKKGDKQSFVVKVSAVAHPSLDVDVGWLTWTDGRHNVTIPLIVTFKNVHA